MLNSMDFNLQMSCGSCYFRPNSKPNDNSNHTYNNDFGSLNVIVFIKLGKCVYQFSEELIPSGIFFSGNCQNLHRNETNGAHFFRIEYVAFQPLFFSPFSRLSIFWPINGVEKSSISSVCALYNMYNERST